jgi:hypothetical protein
MSRTPATFKQSDVMRALKAVRAAGLEVIETKIGRDGSIVLVHKTEGGSAAAPRPYDEWKASNGSR